MSDPRWLTRLRLEDEARDLIGKEIEARVAHTRLDSDVDTAILTRIGAHALRTVLTVDEIETIGAFTAKGTQALLLTNLPCQEFGPTPVTGFADEAELAVTNAIHFGLIGLLGVTPYAVDYENDGRLLRNVVPNPTAAGLTSSWGADAEFFWHTDNPHLPFGEPGTDPRPYVPRYLTFFAVRNTEQVPTEVMAVEAACESLDPRTRARLAMPNFRVAAPDSNDTVDDGSRLSFDAAAIVEHVPGGKFRVRYDRGTTSARTQDAEQALAAWERALADTPCWAPVLAPGQFLIFDNYRVLHRRRAFTPAAPEAARWLRRCYAS